MMILIRFSLLSNKKRKDRYSWYVYLINFHSTITHLEAHFFDLTCVNSMIIIWSFGPFVEFVVFGNCWLILIIIIYQTFYLGYFPCFTISNDCIYSLIKTSGQVLQFCWWILFSWNIENYSYGWVMDFLSLLSIYKRAVIC